MKRATITFPDALEKKLNAYLSQQRTPPSLSTLVQVALEDYLERQRWLALEPRSPTAALELPISDAEVEADVSARPDDYLAEALDEQKVSRVRPPEGTNR